MKRHLISIVLSPLISLRLRLAGVAVARGVRFYGSPIVQRYRGSTITLGAGVEIRSSITSNVLGLAHPTILTTLSTDSKIIIADDVGISGASICAYDAIEVGAGCVIGAGVLITDTDHHPIGEATITYPLDHRLRTAEARSAPIRIGVHVFIGARAMVLKGCSIGDLAVIGAGAVVTSDIPVRGIVVGNPARVVGYVGDHDTTAGIEPGSQNRIRKAKGALSTRP